MPATPPYPEQSISPGPKLSIWTFHNKVYFYCEDLLVSKLKDHALSAVRDCLLNISTATLHIEQSFQIHQYFLLPFRVVYQELQKKFITQQCLKAICDGQWRINKSVNILLKTHVPLFSAGVSKVQETDVALSRCWTRCNVTEFVGSVWLNYVTPSS